jgi:hypothetical protein
MKEWVAVPDGDDALWPTLAEEALTFVGRTHQRRDSRRRT